MLWNMKKENKSGLELAIWAAKTASLLIGFTSTVVLVSLAIAPSFGLLLSSQRSLWIACIQLIIVAIWKLSDAQPHQPDPPETWYDVPSSPTPTSTDGSPEYFNCSPPPETAAKEAASSADDENDSTDATWRAVMEGGGSSSSKPVLKKSSTWERPQKVEMVAGQAAARPEMRKSKTFKEKSEGWRRRDVLVVGQDELFRRVETLIKKHHDHLRLQRQESEQRRFLERLRRSNYQRTISLLLAVGNFGGKASFVVFAAAGLSSFLRKP